MSYGTVQAEKMTTESGYSLGAGNASSFKNRIINGGMTVDQRASASSPVSAGYGADRFFVDKSGAGAVTFGQSSVAPAGFTNSTLVTVTTADTSIVAADIYYFAQVIEGYNIADFGFGTANAKSVTLSFWVRSSVIGTYGAVIANSGGTRSYVSNYTIDAANTWEYKTITVPGDTTGTWLTTNSSGFSIRWGLAAGANWQGTAGVWGTANAVCSSSQVNWMGTLSNTFYITGVQLEVGTVATSFDYRPYGTELALCQRYFQIYGYGANGTASDSCIGTGMFYTATEIIVTAEFKVIMRATPTYSSATVTNGYRYHRAGANTNLSSLPYAGSASTSAAIFGSLSAPVGGTSGYATQVYSQVDGAKISFNAEL